MAPFVLPRSLVSHGLEILGLIFNVSSAYGSLRGAIWRWPLGIFCALSYGGLFWELKLYADVGLQGFFFVTCLLGWRAWATAGPNHGPLSITALTNPQRTVIGAGVLAVALSMGAILHRFTDASLPFWDSITAVLTVAAQLLLVRKKIDTWVAWMLVNGSSVALYYVKGIYLTTALYAFFLVFCGFGLATWRSRFAVDARKVPNPSLKQEIAIAT